MKASSATFAKAKRDLQPTGQSSAKRQPTLTAEQFSLSGRSDPPDPDFNAYRKDLADVALVGRVIASHYAEPLNRRIAREIALRVGPFADAPATARLAPGEPFAMLDDSLGWAWGYAGTDRRVGYVPSDALSN